MDNIMNVNDIMVGSGGSAFLEVDDKRYNLFNIIKFKGQVDLTKKERGLLGSPKKVNYISGWKGTWNATVDFNTSTWGMMMETYKNTGAFPNFKIQTTNQNASGSTGKQRVIYKDCTLDSSVISMFDVDSDSGLQMDISGTFDDFTIKEKFADMPGYRES